MARPRKQPNGAKRESPVQFRLESDLGRLVRGFAQRYELGANEAAKALIALSVVGLDCRYYSPIRQMADAIGGSNPFVAACLRVNAALEGAVVATDQPFASEDARRRFVTRVAQGVLAEQGKGADATDFDVQTGGAATVGTTKSERPDVNQPPRQSDQSRRRKRTIRKQVENEE